MMDATTGICNDAYLATPLAAGKYTLVLSEFFNYPAGSNLSNGFTETGSPTFTSSACPGMSGPFLETDLAPCVQRTGNFLVDCLVHRHAGTGHRLAVPSRDRVGCVWLSL